MKRLLVASLFLLAMSLVAGCGSDPRGIVTGTVTNGGTPVTGAMVLFEDAEHGQSINVSVDANGAFDAKSQGVQGLPPGTYKIAVLPDSFSPPSDEPPLVEQGLKSSSEASTTIPAKYKKTETSGLSITVTEGENPPLTIDLAK